MHCLVVLSQTKFKETLQPIENTALLQLKPTFM
jgi:hypothetical protein